MRKKKRNRVDNTRHLFKILIFCVLGLFFVVVFIIGDYGLYQVYLLNKQKKEITAHIDELNSVKDSLLAERVRLETDLEYIEKIAREKYRMAKRGEKVFRVIERDTSQIIY